MHGWPCHLAKPDPGSEQSLVPRPIPGMGLGATLGGVIYCRDLLTKSQHCLEDKSYAYLAGEGEQNAVPTSAMPVVKSQSRLLEEAKRAWRKASAVCFDVDSTLISVEGIIGLAHLCGAEDEVAQL